MYLSVAKVAGVMVSVDCRTVSQLLAAEKPSEMELLSSGFVLFMSTATWDDSLSTIALDVDVHDDAIRLFDVFQPRVGGYLVDVNRLLELQAGLLARFPKKVMDFLHKSSRLAYNTTMHIYQRIAYSTRSSPSASNLISVNLESVFGFFKIGTAILDAVIDKSSNHLSPENTPNIVYNLSSILGVVLRNGVDAGLNEVGYLLQDHQQKHPDVSPDLTSEAMPHELRLRIWGELIRSRQMQLRVATASFMCNDLIAIWKRYQESLERGDNDVEKRLNLFRHISNFVVSTGIIDYILGSTCHPEITIESSNIIGFLVVSHTYNPTHTDLWFQTVTSTQDPRISDALVRMMMKILQLFDLDNLCYMCEKLDSLPIDAFTVSMRDFCDKIIQAFQAKYNAPQETFPTILYKLLVRLLQESSTYTQQGTIAFQDIQAYAAGKLKELLHVLPNPSARHEVFEICVQDVANKSRTSSGSLIALSFLTGPTAQLAELVSEHDFARLLIDDLASTVASAKADGISPVYAHPVNHARRRFITRIVSDHGNAIDSELGQRLWDLMVGTGVTCQEDRHTSKDAVEKPVFGYLLAGIYAEVTSVVLLCWLSRVSAGSHRTSRKHQEWDHPRRRRQPAILWHRTPLANDTNSSRSYHRRSRHRHARQRNLRGQQIDLIVHSRPCSKGTFLSSQAVFAAIKIVGAKAQSL